MGKKLDNKTVLMIIAPDGFNDTEFFDSKEVFETLGADVVVASKGTGEAIGSKGGYAEIDSDYGSLDVEDFDAVVFIGGLGTSAFLQDPKAHRLARDAVECEKVLGAICMAPSILANAGLLEEKRATSTSSEKKNLEKHGAKFTGKSVETDGKIVTANGPPATKEFAKKIAELINK